MGSPLGTRGRSLATASSRPVLRSSAPSGIRGHLDRSPDHPGSSDPGTPILVPLGSLAKRVPTRRRTSTLSVSLRLEHRVPVGRTYADDTGGGPPGRTKVPSGWTRRSSLESHEAREKTQVRTPVREGGAKGYDRGVLLGRGTRDGSKLGKEAPRFGGVGGVTFSGKKVTSVLESSPSLGSGSYVSLRTPGVRVSLRRRLGSDPAQRTGWGSRVPRSGWRNLGVSGGTKFKGDCERH